MNVCKILTGMGATVSMVNYYMPPVTATNLKDKDIFCKGTLRSSGEPVPKSILFTSTDSKDLPRGYSRYAVNPMHNMVAKG